MGVTMDVFVWMCLYGCDHGYICMDVLVKLHGCDHG